MSRNDLFMSGFLAGLMVLTVGASAADEGGLKLAFSLAAKTCTVTASGKVTDERTGQPIPNAVIRAHIYIWGLGSDFRTTCEKCPYQEVKTDAEGKYQLSFVSPLTSGGAYRGQDSLCLSASAPGYAAKPMYGKRDVNRHNLDFPDFNFTLSPGKLAKGKVVDEEGRPIRGALVRALGNLNGDWNYFGAEGRTYTDESGQFEVWYDPEEIGPYGRLCISRENYGAATFPNIVDKEDFGALTIPKGADLQDIPVYNTSAKSWAEATGPGIAFAEEEDVSVSGQLVPSKNAIPLLGMRVALARELKEAVTADAAGRFRLPYVYPGKHELKVYMPEKYGWTEIGHTEITASPNENLESVRIQLDTLAEARVLFVDAKGNPLSGILAEAAAEEYGYADRKAYGYAAFAKGTESDQDGRAVIYLNPPYVQYISGQDTKDRSLIAENAQKVEPRPGETIENVRVVMVPTAAIRGRLVNASREPLAHKNLMLDLKYAAGAQWGTFVRTDEGGDFGINGLLPGIVAMNAHTLPPEFTKNVNIPFEIKPGEVRDIGDLGVRAIISAKEAYQQAIEHPELITETAKNFLEALRTAEYDLVLEGIKKRSVNGGTFPGGEGYCVGSGHPDWVLWACENFKRDPIQSIELGKVLKDEVKTPWKITFKDGTVREGHFTDSPEPNTPSISYKLVLLDGTVLGGVLHFLYDENDGAWQPAVGMDWHGVQPPLRLPEAARRGQE
jgi:hypothetical protein